MTIFFTGILIWIVVFTLFMYGGRNEPTHHGRGVIAQYGITFGFVAACITWAVGFILWLI